MSDEQQVLGADIYAKLAAEFVTFKDTRGGATFDYITGEQCASRLNETLGFMGWSFKILEHGIHAEADECWALGELTVHVGGGIIRQQFGSQKVKRSRSSGVPLDIGFDLKGAATDAMKKCASLVGVALYLYEKEAPAERAAPAPASINRGNGSAPAAVGPDDLTCNICGEALTETRFKDGTNWAPAQLAVFGRRKHSQILCMPHYKEANLAKRRAEEAVQQVPF
jgi:hypothetical protein